MANYTTANLVKAQLKLAGEFAANDTRYRVPAIFKAFLAGSTTFFPKYKELKTSDTRALEANYWKRTAKGLSTGGRAHNHTGTGGDSGTMTLTWTTYSDTFSMTLKQADTSIYSWQEEFENEIRQKTIDFADGLDNVAINYLFASRTGVNTAAVKGAFEATNDAYEITQSTFGTEAMSITSVVMDINKYQGMQQNVFCDSISWTTFKFQAAQGATNATNLSFQFMGQTFIHAPQLTALAVALDATYTKGFWIVVPANHIGCLDWIPVQNRKGVDNPGINLYGSFMNPVDGLQYAVHSYQGRADGTPKNGQKQDVNTETEISIDLTFQHAPSSVANETPIFAFALV